MKRDILIEVAGIIVMMLTVVACAIYLGHQQEQHSVATRTVLVQIYNLLSDDLQERRNHRQTMDATLKGIEQQQKDIRSSLTTEQDLLDALAKKLKIETDQRKSESDARR